MNAAGDAARAPSYRGRTMQWIKDGGGFISRVGEGPIFTMRVRPKGDGRWVWEIVRGESAPVVATGVVASLGAAKTVAVNFVTRSGLV